MGKGQKERRKGVTMPLSNFLVATGKSEWGDDLDTLPTGPSSREGDDYRGYGGSQMGTRRDRDDMGGKSFGDRFESRNNRDSFANYQRSDRESRPPTAIPDRGPFKAFVGGVPNSFANDDLGALFIEKGCKVLSSQMMIDTETGRPKGYGYVEFEDRDSLVQALESNGMEVEGRSLKVDVQESRGVRNSFADNGGEDKTQGNWRSKMGSAPPPPATTDRFNRGGRPGGAFGDRFSDRGDRYSDRGDRFGDRERSFGSGGFGSGRFSRDDRSSGSAPSGERPRVQLKTAALLEVLGGQTTPEAQKQEGAQAEDVEAITEDLKKSNPFGAARPVDTAAKEAAIEKKLEEMRRSSEHKESPPDAFRGRRDFDSSAFGRRDKDSFDRRDRDGGHDRRDGGFERREGGFGRRDDSFGHRDRDGAFDRSGHSENRSYERASSRDQRVDDVKPTSAAGGPVEAEDSPPSPVAPQSNTYEVLGEE